GLPAEERRDMRGGADSRRRRILAGALGTALLPRLVLAQAQRDAAKNREIYLYKGPDREKRILEGAKKEREVVVYTSLNLKDSVPIVEVFERKYGGVKVQLWRSSSEKVLQRAIAEARAGRFGCDILETNGPEMEAMHREQLLEEFFSPHFKDLPPAAFPKHRHYVADRFNFFTVAYNTNLVNAGDVPNTYEDLLHPRFAGRVGIEAGDADWFGAMVKAMGVARRAPHPYAALLFSDFMLSLEGQTILKERNRVPSSRAVETHLNKFPFEMIDPVITLDEADRWEKLWSDLFLKGQRIQKEAE